MAITPKAFIKKYPALPQANIVKLTNKQKWFIMQGLVETGAFAKYDESVLVERYGSWIREPEFAGSAT